MASKHAVAGWTNPARGVPSFVRLSVGMSANNVGAAAWLWEEQKAIWLEYARECISKAIGSALFFYMLPGCASALKGQHREGGKQRVTGWGNSCTV